jgi:serine/threonine-protein kinase
VPERTDKIIRKMGRYTLVDKLGQGSMGVVYKAYDEMLDRYVALKTMVSDMTTDTELRKRFYQEARLAAKIAHPYIITIFDLGEVDGQIYIAMELLEGEDLKTFIKEERPLSMEQKVDWMIQLAEAFSFAHNEGIIHRDIKPGNIHIRANGDLVVMDFGIARAASSDITRAGAIIGTPEYISPEQILAIKVDHRADIFSLGLVFYEILTRTHPFRSANLPATIHRVLNENPTPPNQIDPTMPKRLNDLVMKAMEKDARDRFQNCKELLQELLDCREEFSRQARTLVNSRDILNHETITYISRLQDLYPRREFLQICEELNYDPSSGQLSDPPLPDDPTYTQASEYYARAHHRMVRSKQYIEGSAQMENLMQTGKALYATGEYKKCIDQMNIILAYSPAHELAAEYIQQSNQRLREQQELEDRRRYMIRSEQEIVNSFHAGDLTTCERTALTLLGIDPQNSIASSYLKKCEERVNRAEVASERKRELQDYIDKAQELLERKHFEECGELLKQCEAINPKNPAVRSLSLRYHSALRAEEKRKRQENEFLETMNRAISLRTHGELNKSLSLLLSARKMRPDSPDVAREIQATEQEIRAGEEYREKLARPRSTPIWLYPSILLILLAVGMFFWYYFTPKPIINETETQQVLATARQQMQKGDLKGSLKTLQDYTGKDPTNAEVKKLLQEVKNRIAQQLTAAQKQKITQLFQMAQAAETNKNHQKAIEHYEDILKLDPLNAQAQSGLANARLLLADETSREQIQKEIDRSYAQARRNFAEGNYVQAKIELTQILALDPQNKKAQKLMADVQKKLDEAELPPDNSKKIAQLIASAKNEIRKKNYDQANLALNELTKLDPNNPQISALRKTIEQETAGPRYGSITINCEPFGNAFIDGQPIGETPIPLRKILIGQHVITIRREGFKQVSKTINVTEDGVQHLQFALEKE